MAKRKGRSWIGRLLGWKAAPSPSMEDALKCEIERSLAAESQFAEEIRVKRQASETNYKTQGLSCDFVLKRASASIQADSLDGLIFLNVNMPFDPATNLSVKDLEEQIIARVRDVLCQSSGFIRLA